MVVGGDVGDEVLRCCVLCRCWGAFGQVEPMCPLGAAFLILVATLHQCTSMQTNASFFFSCPVPLVMHSNANQRTHISALKLSVKQAPLTLHGEQLELEPVVRLHHQGHPASTKHKTANCLCSHTALHYHRIPCLFAHHKTAGLIITSDVCPICFVSKMVSATLRTHGTMTSHRRAPGVLRKRPVREQFALFPFITTYE